MHKLWTFEVRGPGPVSVQPPGNPVGVHLGGTSVFHFMLTDEQAEQVRTGLRGAGLRVEGRPAQEQTEEQRAERLTFLGVGKEDAVYPSLACPPCFWFDPTLQGFCGRIDWPEEMIEEALKTHEAARKCEADCPVKGW